MKLKSIPGYEDVDPEVLRKLEVALERIEQTIKVDGLTEDTLSELGTFFGKSGGLGTNLCHQGSGAPAPQWEMTVGDATLVTCGHKPSHTRLKQHP